ncbi:hypothetical protein Slin14017_G085460 [Septoria linicola]|nr:hypothetical protein Slin14017_G085460 [Septoria linicola]
MSGAGSGDGTGTAPNDAPNNTALGSASDDPLFAYLAGLEDAVVRGPVTAATTLAKLNRLLDKNVPHWRLLKDLSGISTFETRCLMHIEDECSQQLFVSLPAREQGKSGVDTYFRIVDGLVAPAICLEARFVKARDGQTEIQHIASLVFHFNDCEGKQLFDFRCTTADFPFTDTQNQVCDIDFVASGATCQGFNVDLELEPEQRRIFDTLRGLIPTGSKPTIHLELSLNPIK